MSVFHHLPLGRRIPDRRHAVSVSLPTLRDLVGYEEKDPAVLRHITSEYPRFVLHPCLRQLTSHLTRTHRLTGRTLWLTAAARSAAGHAEPTTSGIDPELLRLSVGTEPVDDILAALAEALG